MSEDLEPNKDAPTRVTRQRKMMVVEEALLHEDGPNLLQKDFSPVCMDHSPVAAGSSEQHDQHTMGRPLCFSQQEEQHTIDQPLCFSQQEEQHTIDQPLVVAGSSTQPDQPLVTAGKLILFYA